MTNTYTENKEFELPETTFIHDIENKVFQNIALQCLSKIDGISLTEEGSLINALLGRGSQDKIRGVSIEQDDSSQSIKIKLEVNIRYGLSIPEKAEEIQTHIAREITRLTGLHVASVHTVFKGVTLIANPSEYADSELKVIEEDSVS